MRWRSRGSIAAPPRPARRGQLGVQRLGPAAVELGLSAARTLGRRRRAQVELGERGAQVQAGAADDDRRRARRRAAVDLGVRELGVLGRR